MFPFFMLLFTSLKVEAAKKVVEVQGIELAPTFGRKSSRDDKLLMCAPLPLFTLFQLADKNDTEKYGVISLPLNSLPLQKEIVVEVSPVNLLK